MLKKIWSHVKGREAKTEDLRIDKNTEESALNGSEPVVQSPLGNFRRSEHPGKRVFICEGEACHNSGTNEQIREALLERYKEEEIGTVDCLGNCNSDNSLTVSNVSG